MTNPNNIISAIFSHASSTPSKTAVIHLSSTGSEERRMSYRELGERILAVSRELTAACEPGARILLLHTGPLSFMEGFLGCLHAGMIAIPMPMPKLNRAEARMQAVLDDGGPQAVLTSTAALAQAISATYPNLKVFATDSFPPLTAAAFEFTPAQNLAYIQYTSGSTSTPKGVCITHQNIVANLEAIRQRVGSTGPEIMVTWLPHFHDLGLVWGIQYPLWRGDTLVIMAPGAFIHNPAVWLEAISRYRGTISAAPNFAYDLCSTRVSQRVRERLDLSSFRVCLNGAEPVHGTTLEIFRDTFAECGLSPTTVRPCYGLAEATLIVSMEEGLEATCALPFHIEELEAGRAQQCTSLGRPLVPCGAPLIGEDVRIVDPESCMELPADRIGEVWTRGPSVANGFWNVQSDASSEFCGTLVPHGETGFLRTGDLGFLHGGRLFLYGRLKDLVIIQGRNIAPHALERCTWESHAALAPDGVAAFQALIANSEEEGLVLVAEIEREARKTDPQEIAEAIRSAIHSEFQAEVYAVVLLSPRRLPRTSSGKVQRRRCRELFMQGYSDSLRVITFGEAPTERGIQLEGIIRAILRSAAKDFQASLPLVVQGFDSLKAAELQSRLAAEMGIRISLEELHAGCSMDSLLHRKVDATHHQIHPTAILDSEAPFPLTDIQQAYWIGRNPELALGGTSCQVCFEFACPQLDHSRLENAWNILVNRHPMLRCIVDAEGRQRILPSVPRFQVEVEDLSSDTPAEQERRLGEMRQSLSLAVLPADRWPLFASKVVKLGQNKSLIHFQFDLLTVDFGSLQILSQELETLYADPQAILPPLGSSFQSYVTSRQTDKVSQERARILADWRAKTPRLPAPPEFPFVQEFADLHNPVFVRREAMVDLQTWKALQVKARLAKTSPTAILLAAFATTVSRWNSREEFNLTLTLFDRPGHFAGTMGDFTTTAPITARPWSSFAEAFTDIATQVHRGMDARLLGGVALQRELGGDNAFSPAVVFTSLLGHGNVPLFSWLGENRFTLSRTPQVCLDYQVSESPSGLHIVWDAVDALFPQGFLDDMLQSYHNALRALVQEDWSKPLPLELPRRQLEIRALTNQSTRILPQTLLHILFEASADRSPQAPAVIDHRRILSYAELESLSNSLAQGLSTHNILPGTSIAVAIHKGWEQAVAVLAVLKAGGAYLPLDPDLPLERRTTILQKAHAKVVISTRQLLSTIAWPSESTTISIEDATQQDAPRLQAVQSLSDTAYIIFTSGSTGTPKGVMIDHRGACNTLADLQDRYTLSPQDRVLSLSALNFDLSVFDFFGMWACGGCVVLPDPAKARDPRHWIETMREHDVTLWNTVPALMEMLVEESSGRREGLPQSLRLVFLSGDWIPVTLPDRIRALDCKAQLVSMGGATEASIWSILHEIGAVNPSARSIPYGKPMANQSFHILDQHMQAVPEWIPGRLFIGGIGVAQGYCNAPELTAERFVINPCTSEKLYWTGDLGRYHPDGSIEFLGREDFQVKIQGFRIELEEIEAVLLRHPAVRAAAATVADARGGGKKLVAYWVGKSQGSVEAESLRKFLADSLPSYMVPLAMAELEALPLSSNGKVDRKALPEIQTRKIQQEGSTSQDQRHLALAALCQELLGLSSLPGPDANFFGLGGDSLAATRLAARVRRELGADLTLPSIYANPRLGEMAKLIPQIESNTSTVPKIAPASFTAHPEERFEPFALTEVQHAYWLGRTRAFELGNVACQGYMEIEATNLDPIRFEAAWARLMEHHDMLRAKVLSSGVQVIEPTVPDPFVMWLDLSQHSPQAKAQELALQREQRSHLKLDPREGRMFRACLVGLGQGQFRFLLNVDLLVCDFHSIQIISADLKRFYQNPSLPHTPLTLTFRDYLASVPPVPDAQKERDRNYWYSRIATLAPAPMLPLLVSADRIEHPRFRRTEGRVPRELWLQIMERGRQQHLTPSVLVLAIFSRCLAEFCGQADFTLNLTLFSRQNIHPEVGSVVGDFTTVNLLEILGARDPSFGSLAARIQKRLWDDLSHGSTTSIQVLRELGTLRKAARKALMPVVFTSTIGQGSAEGGKLFSWLGDESWGISQTPQVLLDHQVMEDPQGLLLRWDWVEQAFAPELLERMFARYIAIFSELASGEWSLAPQSQPQANTQSIYSTQRPTGMPQGRTKDPVEKLRFKLAQHGMRKDLASTPITLGPDTPDPVHLANLISRRSYRHFVRDPLRKADLGHLLEVLAQRSFPPLPFPKALYASAGGLYPVQAYVTVAPGRVEGLESGAYWYDANHHALVSLGLAAKSFPKLAWGGSEALFEHSGFQIFLFANPQAIEPLYGDWWREFCLLEAGAMSHCLEREAPHVGLGLCQIGGFPADIAMDYLQLPENWTLLNTLVGGAVAQEDRGFQALVRESKGVTRAIREIEPSKTHTSASMPMSTMTATPMASATIATPAIPIENNDILPRLKALWSRFLGEEPVGIRENFFDAGGNSLLAVQLANAIRDEWNIEIDTIAIFEAPCLADLEGMIRQRLGSKAPEYITQTTQESTPPQAQAFACITNSKPPVAPSIVTSESTRKDDILPRLKALWTRFLGEEPVGIRENFFDAGGNSLLAVQLTNAIRDEWNIEIDTIAIFEAPCLADLEGMIRQRLTTQEPELNTAPISTPTPGGNSLRERMLQARSTGSTR